MLNVGWNHLPGLWNISHLDHIGPGPAQKPLYLDCSNLDYVIPEKQKTDKQVQFWSVCVAVLAYKETNVVQYVLGVKKGVKSIKSNSQIE